MQKLTCYNWCSYKPNNFTSTLLLEHFLTSLFFYFKKVFIKDNYKIVQNYFNSIYSIPLWDSWGERYSRTPKTTQTTSGKQHPNIYFWYIQNIHWFTTLLISAFSKNSVWYFWFVTRKFSSIYLSKFNISAADTEPINNHEIITLASFLELYICYLSRFVDCLM